MSPRAGLLADKHGGRHVKVRQSLGACGPVAVPGPGGPAEVCAAPVVGDPCIAGCPLGGEAETLGSIVLLGGYWRSLAPPAGTPLRDDLFPACTLPCWPAITFGARGVEWCHPESSLSGVHQVQ
ncbi:hypothetical protein NDU88_005347 [Pleurodeles waltl]|uniref:Uncharacterized protein n=1 Tax=Pleurodeles waltl TaxID=8319 RepID=A0AAV7TU38_PLEWA|nr:hypothetical protein NDU88_005347 [Pleurodeles waltl]